MLAVACAPGLCSVRTSKLLPGNADATSDSHRGVAMEPREPTHCLLLSIPSVGAHRQRRMHICEVRKLVWNLPLP